METIQYISSKLLRLAAFALFGVMAALIGCTFGEERVDYPDENEADQVYLRFTISTTAASGTTRADPTGGEDGDGREPGQAYENDVKDLYVFLFTGFADDIPLHPIYFGQDELKPAGSLTPDIEKIYTVEKKLTGLSEDSYFILAVANVGEAWGGDLATLPQLLDKIETGKAWEETTGATGYTGFKMSSENVGQVSEIHASTEQFPAQGKIVIERLAARVDYKAENSYQTTSTAPDAVKGTVTIEGAALVNCFDKGTFFFKQVSENGVDDIDGIRYFAQETSDNYVVDPYTTSQKAEGDYLNYFDTFSAQDGWQDLLAVGTEVTDSESNTWHRIGYTLENTNDIRSLEDLHRYATGVVFKAKFAPEKVINDAGATVDYTAGTTFYRYNGKLYAAYAALLKNEKPGFPETEPDDCRAIGVDKYENGICYYTWWIKHNNDGDDDAFGPMEYAIVRNNLYQLTVTSVGDLGDPVPGTTSLIVEVAVKNWTLLPGEVIPLE